MAEQQKESPPKDLKKKNSLLDDDFGTEFLGSWKPMSMADDDAMDFSFNTGSKSKKKIFDFEKMDMNFDLDTAFGKISSFKVDMSDLDFTSPPKKPSQSTDKKGEASCAKGGKQDGFNFSFDFNELDSFNLNSNLLNVDTSNDDSYLRKKGVTAEGNNSEDAKKPNINDDDRGVRSSSDNKTTKPRASERMETLNTENSVGNLGNLVSRQDISVSKFSSSENLDTEVKNQTSDISKITSMKEMDQEKNLSKETKSTKSKSEQVIDKVLSKSVSQSDSEQDTVSEKHTNVSLSGTRRINVAADKQVINDGIVREAINLGSSAEEVSNDTPPENSYSSSGNITKVDSLKKNSCDNSIRENKRTDLECHLATSSSNPIVDKVSLMKDKNLQVKKSNLVSMLENKRSLKNPSSTSGTKSVVSSDCKKNADIHLRSIAQERNSFKSNETKFGSKMVSDSFLGSSKVIRDAPAVLGSKDDPNSCNARKGVVFDGSPSAGKLAGNMKSFHEDVNKRKAMFLETGMSTKNVNILSSQVNPCSSTEKTVKLTTQISLNSQPEASGKESFQKSKITHIEGNKLSSFKACKITPAFSSVKTSRNIGANSVLATSLHQKEANSLASSEQRKETQAILASNGDHLADSGDNQKASARFLKRKSIEISEADLTSLRPLKRLPQSPIRSRNNESKESSGKVEQVERKSNDLAYYDSTSGLESPSEIKVTEVEIPDSVLMEDNGNVEKTEAYMKELENICNMLKKRHEEAKELLVRAVVNDNNLLMLNHPIYEEKIRKVQKFASQLMSKEIQT
ncbi:uncharacterized protein At4g18490-like isoform X2 [Vicia villosa]|uniref:uncharacterized protein At4g18490-like isoform X2 n=1 Tax=Vicia villosa TaxID=3911 RepID=UPI00273B401C|nr:uncharacterized protein At4g18490-like isoform X2 [Vicia villosa]